MNHDDDFELVDSIYIILGERVKKGDMSALRPEERVVVLVWDAMGLISIDGIADYICTECSWEQAPDAFDTIGIPEVASAIRCAFAQFSGGVPSGDPDIRKFEAKKFKREKGELHDKLNRVVWSADEKIVLKTAEFIRANGLDKLRAV